MIPAFPTYPKLRLVPLLAILVAACQPPTPTAAPSSSVTPLPSPSATATLSAPSASPTSVTYLDPNSLPPASLKDEGATSICDPYDSEPDPNAGIATITCEAGSILGLRAIHTAVPVVDRIYLRRIPCQQAPCSKVVTVTGWSNGATLSVVIDLEHNTVTAPRADPLATWPSPPQSEPPPIKRIAIAGAPSEVREREPYPYCGDAPDGPSPIRACFRAAVLDGRPAEMIDHNVVTGDIWVLRFDGQGLIWRYGEWEAGGWFRDGGSLYLSVDESLGSYYHWVRAKPIS